MPPLEANDLPDIDSTVDEIVSDITGSDNDTAAPLEPASPRENPSSPSLETPGGAAPPADEFLTPPKAWRADVHAQWTKLPLEVRREVLKREEDIFRGINQYKAQAGNWGQVAEVFKPYEPLLRQHNLTYKQVLEPLLQGHRILSLGAPQEKEAYARNLLKAVGLQHILQEPSQSQPWNDPTLAPLHQELSTLKSTLHGYVQQQDAQLRQKVDGEVATFLKDKQYLDVIGDDMTKLVEAGYPLQDAYDRALWGNSEVRAKETARLAAEAATKQREELRARSKQSLRASSPNLRPASVPQEPTSPKGSIDNTLEETLRSIKSRA